MTRLLRTTCITALGAALSLAGAAHGAPAPGEVIPGSIIVAYEKGTTTAQIRQSARGTRATTLRRSPIAVIDTAPGTEAAVMARLRANPLVRLVARDRVVRAQRTANDTYLTLQWGLRNTGGGWGGTTAGRVGSDIGAESAWDIRTSGAVVAVIDTGVDLSHSDLACNQWINPGEAGGGKETNRIDDDGNGLVDDWRGWDFVEGNNDPTDDVDGHGTHVAGTIAACGNNNEGVSGVAWSAPIMAVRVLGDDGSGSFSDVLKGFDYAGQMGARVANASLGGSGDSALRQAFAEVINAWPNTVYALAAGNDGASIDAPVALPCEAAEIATGAVCVAASDNRDQLASFSNFGSNVTIAAPGVDIASTLPNAQFGWLSGTSMATPHVSGVAALVAAQGPGLTAAQIEDALEASASRRPGLAKITGMRRLDAEGALRRLSDSSPPSPASAITPSGSTSSTPLIRWAAATDASGIREYEVSIDGVLRDWSEEPSWQSPALSAGAHTVSIVAVDRAGVRSPAVSQSFTVDASAPSTPEITSPSAGSWSGPEVVVRWDGASDPHTGISGYRIEVDGSLVANLPASARTHALSLREGTRTIAVTAINGVGQEASATVSVRVDATAPLAPVLSSPTTGMTLTGTTTPLRWVAGTDSGSGLAGFRVVVNGTGSDHPATASSVIATLTTGEHRWYVEAVDAVGNRARSAETTFRVGPPPAGTLAIARGARFATTTRVGLALTLPAGAEAVTGAETGSMASARPISLTAPTWNFSGKDGSRTLWVRYRVAGVSYTISDTIILDRAAPVVTQRTLRRTAKSATLRVMAKDVTSGLASMTARPARGATRIARRGMLTITLKKGSRLTVRATDRAGNVTARTIRVR